MKNNVFKSFRFEIVLYSLLSLLYMLISLAIIHIGVYIIVRKNPHELTGASTAVITIISITAGIILFITYFLLLTKKFVTYIKELSEGINEISLGNLDNRIEIKNEDEFALIADKLNHMADDIKKIMENERRSEYAKNELITSVAHDLRTPLTSIIGYLDLVSTKELPQETQKKYFEIAYNKSKRLEKLIEDLFTFTKFNFGEVKANYTQVDMVKLLSQLVDEFYPSFSEFGLEYDFVSSNSSVIIKADGDLLARAFANLISNAIKYGREGKKIHINLEKKETSVMIDITNYGEIIPQKDLEQIFRRFYRVESSRSSETGGSGLGLAIAQSVIEMHGGTISAKSDQEGTVFTVELMQE
ncbi:MAG: HAMP domain-containing sensor histidine kinase [Mobilitalea sp.]